jgi:clan AA aspartic protease (TIGR02281 family)
VHPEDRLKRPAGGGRFLTYLGVLLVSAALLLAVFLDDVRLALRAAVFAPPEAAARSFPEIGIPLLPRAAAEAREVKGSLSRLMREPCDRAAIFPLTDGLVEISYKREAVAALLSFASRCGQADNAHYRAAHILLELSEYQQVADVMTGLVERSPWSPEYRSVRSEAYDGLHDYTSALADLVSTVSLVSDPASVSSGVFLRMAKLYSKLGRVCEAITPIQMWIAPDPAKRDTPQTRAIIHEYSKNGRCESTYAKGSDSFPRAGNGVPLVRVQVNGLWATMLLDTGASSVSVTEDFAARARVGLDPVRTVSVQTANGVTEGKFGSADSIKLGRLEAKNVGIVTVNQRDFGRGVDGLLGMSFLARYDLAITARDIKLTQKRAGN